MKPVLNIDDRYFHILVKTYPTMKEVKKVWTNYQLIRKLYNFADQEINYQMEAKNAQ